MPKLSDLPFKECIVCDMQHHRLSEVLDHPDGSVTLDKLSKEVKDKLGGGGAAEVNIPIVSGNDGSQVTLEAGDALLFEPDASTSIDVSKKDKTVKVGVKVNAIDVVQTTGDSKTAVMCQKATTDAIGVILEAFETENTGAVSNGNLLDPNNSQTGYYSYSTETELTYLPSTNNCCTIDPVQIPSGETKVYISTRLDTTSWADSNRNINIAFVDKGGAVLLRKFISAATLPVSFDIPSGTECFHLWTMGNNPAILLSLDNFCVSIESDVFEEYKESEDNGTIRKPTELKESFVPKNVLDDIQANKDAVDNVSSEFSEAFDTEIINLLDPKNSKSGYYSGTTGSFVHMSSAMQSCTEKFVPIPSRAISISVSTDIDTSEWVSPNRTVQIGFADESGSYLSQKSKKVNELPLTVDIPKGATQLHFWTLGNTPSNTLLLGNFCVSAKSIKFVEYETQKQTKKIEESYLPQEMIGNILYGKKWCVVGDSFTDNFGADKPSEWFFDEGRFIGKSKVYANLIADRNGMNLQWMAASGRTIATPADGTFTNTFSKSLYQQIDDDVDYITIMLGINDVGHNKNANGEDFGEDTSGDIPLGTADDTTNATFCGAWNVVLQYLVEHHTNAHIGIIVPNALGEYAYKNAIIEAAKKHGIPYIDFNGDERTKAMHRALNTDISQVVKDILLNKYSISETNRHPNALAHSVESTIVENFLRSL